MNEEEIKKMQEENAALKTASEALKKENDEFKVTNTELDKTVKAKDVTIEEMKIKAKEQGANFKKLRDMSEKEKELLSEKEMEMLQRQEQLEEDRAKDKKEMDDFRAIQRTELINNIALKQAKGDKELAEKIKVNLTKLNPENLGKAITETDLTPHIAEAFNMLGIQTQPDPLRQANNTDGTGAPVKRENDFSETTQGKELGNALGLGFNKPVETNNGGDQK